MKILVCCLVIALAALESHAARLGASPHIVGGEEAPRNTYPFQAAITVNQRGGGGAFCGGALLSWSWVLTSAACLHEFESGEAVLGSHNLYGNGDEARQEVPIRGVFLAPGWNPYTLANDIGLAKIQGLQMIENYVTPIRLPKYSQNSLYFWQWPTATLTGFGFTKDDTEEYPENLQHVSTQIVSNLYCNLRYWTTQVDDTKICASGWGKGFCTGDSGGPLFIDENGTKVIIGVASFNGERCEGTQPLGFTRVTHFLGWIYETTRLSPRPEN